MTTGLTPATVAYLISMGRRQTDIAREYGVSRQYVNKLAKQAGHEPLVTVVSENFPWELTQDMQQNTIYQALRLLGHYQLDKEALSGSSKDKVRAFLRKLTLFNQVVDYDPDYPAIPGLVNTPGFAYLPRTTSDGDYVIKIRPGTNLTTIGEKIWRIPEVWPSED